MSEKDRIEEFAALGERLDEVVLNIDYHIVEHFSRHLYASPNKAIEELVVNGFDAFASEAYVYTPGRFVPAHVAVWDDGWSMDVQGLKGLWFIAASPKEKLGRVAEVEGRGKRDMIGKFGIGKLAGYAVGNTITHLCRRGDEFLLVSVDYREVHGEGRDRPTTTENPLRKPIIRLDEPTARRFVEGVFSTGEKASSLRLFDGRTWTLAVIGDLKGDGLSQGRLAWVLGNGMPLRPDFRVFVNDDEVVPKLDREAKVEWTFGDAEVRSALESEWQAATTRGDVAGTLGFATASGLDSREPSRSVPFADLPNLGRVWGTIRLFDDPLVEGRQADYGRSYGFFLMVRHRLLNVNDEKVLLSDPSFSTFYRSQFVLHVDALDEELLADRERVRQDTPRARELAVLQRAVYKAARSEIDNRDQRASEEERRLTLLPVRSREHFRRPLVALLMKTGPDAEFDLGNARVERRPLGPDHPLAEVSPEGFVVNASHPYYESLERRLGKGKKAEEFYRVYGLFAVADLLLQGVLYDLGVPDDKVAQVATWRDGLFRELAKSYGSAPSDLLIELVNSSYVGGAAFEGALSSVLTAMGFHSERRGQSGREDVYLLASTGPGTYALTFEAKGSVKPLANDDADVGAAAAHRDAVGAEHAIIVAREFAGFARNGAGEPAIINECRAAGGVSIMTVETLGALLQAMEDFGYPLDVLKDVFVELEPPAAKLARIRSLQSPTEDFDYRRLLEAIWERQHNQARGDVVAYRALWQDRDEWKRSMKFEEFERKLVALETLASGRMRIDQGPREVYMLQSPDIIVQQIERSLARRSGGEAGVASE